MAKRKLSRAIEALAKHVENLEAEHLATLRELYRWKTGTQIEGDYVPMIDPDAPPNNDDDAPNDEAAAQ